MALKSSSIRLSVEPLSEDVRLAYDDLLPEQAAMGADFLDWKFGATPAGRGLFSVARVDSRIVGLSAYLRLDAKLGTARGRSYQAIDSVVANDMQGRGVFTKLASAFSEAEGGETDVVWGFPNANAAPAWFGKLGWRRHGEAPFLIKPLRTGYLLRRFGLPIDVRVSRLRDSGARPASDVDDRVNEIWNRFAAPIGFSVFRDLAYLRWRLFGRAGGAYRVVQDDRALVASTIANKHGGRIGYMMEALGERPRLEELLRSEVGRLADEAADVALAWCYPWSPNYAAYRRLGFMPLPPRLRPIAIHVGSRAYSPLGGVSDDAANWYLSFLDSDTN